MHELDSVADHLLAYLAIVGAEDPMGVVDHPK